MPVPRFPELYRAILHLLVPSDRVPSGLSAKYDRVPSGPGAMYDRVSSELSAKYDKVPSVIECQVCRVPSYWVPSVTECQVWPSAKCPNARYDIEQKPSLNLGHAVVFCLHQINLSVTNFIWPTRFFQLALLTLTWINLIWFTKFTYGEKLI